MTPVRVILTGDSLIVGPVELANPGHQGLRDLIAAGDVAATNAEILFSDRAGPPAAATGIHLSTTPDAARHLQQLGFDLFATANNHALDFGVDGLLASLAAMDTLGMAHAGTGVDLTAATRPAIVTTPAGRVALISCATDLGPGWPAADASPRVAARPGVNQLRVQTGYDLDPARLAALEDIVGCLGIAAKEAYDHAMGPGGGTASTGTRVLGGEVNVAAAPGVRTSPHPADLARITAAIRAAAAQADLVLVYLHTHVDLGDLGDTPQFCQDFAHSCVDAGAAAVWASGPHVLRGVEIYQGRPVLYGLGNFWFHYDQIDSLAPEVLADLGLPPDASAADFAQHTMAGFREDRRYWESAAADCRFTDGALTELRLHPIELGFDDTPPARGTPRLAGPEATERILTELDRRSLPLDTTLIREAGIGIVRPT